MLDLEYINDPILMPILGGSPISAKRASALSTDLLVVPNP
jgi:hypothetical protein